MTLADKLNLYGISFNTDSDGVTLEACPEDEALFGPDGTVTDEALNAFLDVLGDFKAWIADNPRDRNAGLVCFVGHDGEKAWYDAPSDCVWLPTR